MENIPQNTEALQFYDAEGYFFIFFIFINILLGKF